MTAAKVIEVIEASVLKGFQHYVVIRSPLADPKVQNNIMDGAFSKGLKRDFYSILPSRRSSFFIFALSS